MTYGIANPFPLGTAGITGNPGPMVPSRQPGVVKSQAIGGVPQPMQPEIAAAQLAAAQAAGQGTFNIGGANVSIQGGQMTATIGGVSITANIPPGVDLSGLLTSLLGALTGSSAAAPGGCGCG